MLCIPLSTERSSRGDVSIGLMDCYKVKPSAQIICRLDALYEGDREPTPVALTSYSLKPEADRHTSGELPLFSLLSPYPPLHTSPATSKGLQEVSGVI